MTTPAWIASFADWLTPRRIRAHAAVLAICLWGVCIADYATSGVFDRAGNIKFQDFLQFPAAARLVHQGRAIELYNPEFLTEAVRSIAGPGTTVQLQYFYGPQVALPFVPLLGFPFLSQATLWVALSILIYSLCVYLLGKTCPALKSDLRTVALAGVAYPPLFHFFVRGQISAVMLACFTAAYLAFHARREWLAGVALGLLFVKPQFLVAIPIVLLLGHSWCALAGLVLSVSAQLTFIFAWFGPAVVRSYFNMLLHSASQPGSTELSLSPIQMHSLRSLWVLLIPSSLDISVLYILSSIAVIALTIAIWKSPSQLTVRFSALVIAAILVNPHLYIYDLLALLPALLLLAEWALSHPRHSSVAALRVLLYLTFMLPLFGPIARWTHLQVSVPAFGALLFLLWRISRGTPISTTHKLETRESAVV